MIKKITDTLKGQSKVIKQGFIFNSAVLSALITINLSFIFFAKISFADFTTLIYMMIILIRGYLWKKEYKETFSFFSGQANERIFWYSFGAAIPLLGVITVQNIDTITELNLGLGLPIFIIFLLVFALFSQTINFIGMLVMGGFFYRKKKD